MNRIGVPAVAFLAEIVTLGFLGLKYPISFHPNKKHPIIRMRT